MRKIVRYITYSLLVMTVAGLLAACFGAGAGGVVFEVTGISLSEGTLSPAFDPGTTEYAATVAYTVDSVTVTVTTDDTNLTVSVNDTAVLPGNASTAINLSDGSNVVTVVVSDGDGSVTYTVTVTKEGVPDIAISGLSDYDDPMSGGDFVSGSTPIVDFGTPAGVQPIIREITFTIRNDGVGPLRLTGSPIVLVSGPQAGDFSVPTLPSETTIPPSGTLEFVIRFTAIDTSPSTRNATVTIETNDPDEDTFTLSLQGNTGCVTST